MTCLAVFYYKSKGFNSQIRPEGLSSNAVDLVILCKEFELKTPVATLVPRVSGFLSSGQSPNEKFLPQKSCYRVSSGNDPLTKKPEDSGYKLAPVGVF